MKIRIIYSKESEKFLSKNSNIITEDKVDKLLKSAARHIMFKENINIDLKKMKGSDQNLFRIRKGKVRILFNFVKNDIVILTVEDIGFRGNIY
ncbi:MAG: hypothetical protein WAT71_03390 [Ignavibacteria bacterium]